MPGREKELAALASSVDRTESEDQQDDLTTVGPNPPDPELKRWAEEARGWAWVESSQKYKPLTMAQAERLPAPSQWEERGIDR